MVRYKPHLENDVVMSKILCSDDRGFDIKIQMKKSMKKYPLNKARRLNKMFYSKYFLHRLLVLHLMYT